MNAEDKQFLACMLVWLDWNIYQSVKCMDSEYSGGVKSFEMMRLEAKELVEEFTHGMPLPEEPKEEK